MIIRVTFPMPSGIHPSGKLSMVAIFFAIKKINLDLAMYFLIYTFPLSLTPITASLSSLPLLRSLSPSLLYHPPLHHSHIQLLK